MFKDALKELRTKHKLTQEELATKIGLAKSTISMYENGNREPNMEQLEAFADYFNVSMNYLHGKHQEIIPVKAKTKGVKIPVLGEVAAGVPIEAVEDVLDYEEITPELASTGDFFALQIRGDSMEPRFCTGDVVIVRQQPHIETGEIAVVLVNGNAATVKKIQKSEAGIMLIPSNHAYEPKFYSNAEIQNLPIQILGKVVELRAKF